MDARIRKILLLMEDNLSLGLPLGRMAQSVNLSSSRLSHLFKSELGMSPAQYLKTLRMKKARGLLENTFLSVKEIAIQVGLGDGSHFVQDFKKSYGLTPIQYRNAFVLTRGGRRAATSAYR